MSPIDTHPAEPYLTTFSHGFTFTLAEYRSRIGGTPFRTVIRQLGQWHSGHDRLSESQMCATTYLKAMLRHCDTDLGLVSSSQRRRTLTLTELGAIVRCLESSISCYQPPYTIRIEEHLYYASLTQGRDICQLQGPPYHAMDPAIPPFHDLLSLLLLSRRLLIDRNDYHCSQQVVAVSRAECPSGWTVLDCHPRSKHRDRCPPLRNVSSLSHFGTHVFRAKQRTQGAWTEYPNHPGVDRLSPGDRGDCL